MSLLKSQEVISLKKTKTFVVLVEDNEGKKDNLIPILEKEGIEYIVFSSINPTLKFVVEPSNKIDGIILDMGLPVFDDGRNYKVYGGIEILEELKRKEINIPVLINSEQLIDIDSKEFPFVFKERMFRSFDVETLRNFLMSLSNKEEQ